VFKFDTGGDDMEDGSELDATIIGRNGSAFFSTIVLHSPGDSQIPEATEHTYNVSFGSASIALQDISSIKLSFDPGQACYFCGWDEWDLAQVAVYGYNDATRWAHTCIYGGTAPHVLSIDNGEETLHQNDGCP
jgi:hypothetical protein